MHGLIDRPKEWLIIGPGGMLLASFDDEEMARWYAKNIVQRRGIDCRVERRYVPLEQQELGDCTRTDTIPR